MAGPIGPTGAAGISGFQTVYSANTAAFGNAGITAASSTASADCPRGTTAVGGGMEPINGNLTDLFIQGTFRTPTGWKAIVGNRATTTQFYKVFATCATVTN